eukprot:GHVH01008975.1.p1 GENE.GHVH01008975.1~~GHVH01008975.1.p1  ORF type:complete len:649 (-),score=117.61 GHVH01008975.1:218-1873(-)
MEDAFGYDRNSNPFGDDELAKPFVWKKKVMHDASQGIIMDTRVDAVMNQTVGKVKEIEEVRRRRVEREKIEDELEESRVVQARERAQENYDEWTVKEDAFAKGVAMDRIAYRLESGRERHLDLVLKAFILAHYHRFDDIRLSTIALHDVALHGVVHGLDGDELAALLAELQVVIETVEQALIGIPPKDATLKFVSAMNSDGMPLDDPSAWPLPLRKELFEFLKAFRTLIFYAQRDKGIQIPAMQPPLELNKEVAPEVARFFSGQTVEELVALRSQVVAALDTAADTNFFEGVLDLIPYYIARGVCQSVTDLAGRTVTAIEREQFEQECQMREKEEEAEKKKQLNRVYRESPAADAPVDSPDGVPKAHDITTHPLASLPNELMKRMVDDVTDYKSLMEDRKEKLILYKSRKRGKRIIPKDPSLQVRSENLKPRKPRFENRVRTGYDWNRYNQTHYDVNNPPPKQVQGYKFNIYYPDLIDKSQTPSWVLEPCSDGAEENTVQLRFTAGPPYQDIAFRILDREWDIHPNANFINKFEKGVLQLHFSLKRLRYRK